jgi:simple sugar transport system permease protein
VSLIPSPVVAVAWHVLPSHTRPGFAIDMLGSNPEAARYSGINDKRTLILIYTLSSVTCTIAGVLMLSRFDSVRVSQGEALLLLTVLACFLGGFGKVLPVVLASVILEVLSSGLNLLGANQHLSAAIWGLFLIAIMVIRFPVARWRPRPRKD